MYECTMECKGPDDTMRMRNSCMFEGTFSRDMACLSLATFSPYCFLPFLFHDLFARAGYFNTIITTVSFYMMPPICMTLVLCALVSYLFHHVTLNF